MKTIEEISGQEVSPAKSTPGDHGQQPPQREVKIWVDGKERPIKAGEQTVAEIKKVGKVPQTYDLDQVVDGKLKPLPDDGVVTIQGGEKFQSHPKDGGSSNH